MERTLQADYVTEVSRPAVASHARCEDLRVASCVNAMDCRNRFSRSAGCAFSQHRFNTGSVAHLFAIVNNWK